MRVSLDNLEIGGMGEIYEIRTERQEIYRKLMNLGFLPGNEVKVLQRSPVYLIETGFTQLALDKETCHLIRVVLKK